MNQGHTQNFPRLECTHSHTRLATKFHRIQEGRPKPPVSLSSERPSRSPLAPCENSQDDANDDDGELLKDDSGLTSADRRHATMFDGGNRHRPYCFGLNRAILIRRCHNAQTRATRAAFRPSKSRLACCLDGPFQCASKASGLA
jgi:hypothetical protein